MSRWEQEPWWLRRAMRVERVACPNQLPRRVESAARTAPYHQPGGDGGHSGCSRTMRMEGARPGIGDLPSRLDVGLGLVGIFGLHDRSAVTSGNRNGVAAGLVVQPSPQEHSRTDALHAGAPGPSDLVRSCVSWAAAR